MRVNGVKKEKIAKLPVEKEAIRLMKKAENMDDIERTEAEQELINKFNMRKDVYVAELVAVLTWLVNDKKIMMTPSMTGEDRVEFFRGVHFHHLIL